VQIIYANLKDVSNLETAKDKGTRQFSNKIHQNVNPRKKTIHM
jgi:hypothetical protein